MLNAVTSEPPENPYHPHIREIVQQERLSQILESLGVSVRKLDDIISGLSATIARKPEKFAREPHTGWSRIVVKGFPPEIPRLAIWFTYDADHIYIKHVQSLAGY
jgi:hypothetical protein